MPCFDLTHTPDATAARAAATGLVYIYVVRRGCCLSVPACCLIVVYCCVRRNTRYEVYNLALFCTRYLVPGTRHLWQGGLLQVFGGTSYWYLHTYLHTYWVILPVIRLYPRCPQFAAVGSCDVWRYKRSLYILVHRYAAAVYTSIFLSLLRTPYFLSSGGWVKNKAQAPALPRISTIRVPGIRYIPEK